MGSVNQFLHRKLSMFLGTYLHPLFGFIISHLFSSARRRFRRKEYSVGKNSNYSEINLEENTVKHLDFIEAEPETKPPKEEVREFLDSENDVSIQEQTPDFCFSFKFPSYEEFRSNGGGDIGSTSSKQSSITVGNGDEFLSQKGFMQTFSEAETISHEMPDNFADEVFEKLVSEKTEAKTLNGEEDQWADSEKHDVFDEKDSFSLGSDSDSVSSSHISSVVNRLIDSYNEGFLSDGEFETEFKDDELMGNGEMADSDEESLSFGDEEGSDILEDLHKFETFHSEFLSEKDFQQDFEKSMDGSDNCGEPNSKDLPRWELDESNKLELLWEHQELIEQLKMELKKVRATGLPTILEESESPKIMEDLKPWKIDEKFQHEEDPIDELRKLYKSYRERMRKLDILNYQKMYAIGFLQLKDPLQSNSSQKSSPPTLTSLLSRSFSPSKGKKSETEPTMKFIRELQSDLEVVYVGQVCLSWEFLHWQYGKALELWESDPRGVCQYNEVAGEFQQFQVVMQRFVEDEPFHGQRVENYVKSRCNFRNLLQVPVIKEDSPKERKMERRRERGDYVITSDVLVEIMEESIRVFWRFVRADKDCANVIVKGRRGSQLDLQDPVDSQLLMEVRTSLQKKKKKLKELLRSENCILRRFKKCREGDDDSDQVLYFFSQVDMKLVSRVLNMSRITREQLDWCLSKLNKISFTNRRIHVEPSFLLFPC